MYIKKHTSNMYTVQIKGWSKTYFTNRKEAIRLAYIDYKGK